MNRYLILDENDFSVGVIECMHEIDTQIYTEYVKVDIGFCNYPFRKFDRDTSEWLDEYKQQEHVITEHEQITRCIYEGNTQIQGDSLLNMEISTDTNARTMTIGDDSLLLMEMLLTIDEKLNQLLQPK